jgi:8-oxo-dGTP diphosphatase
MNGMNHDLHPASSAIIVHEDRYLLVLRANPPAADMYAFPGGRAEPGETPAETALRELYEETGLKGEEPRLFASYDLPGRTGGFHLSVFRVECRNIAPLVAADDAAEAGWFTASEIASMPVPESVAECIARLEDLRNATLQQN